MGSVATTNNEANMDSPSVPHLTVYIDDGPEGKEIFIDEDGPNGGTTGHRFKTLEGATACIRTWVAEQVREATGQYDYNKMQKLRENLEASFSGLKPLQNKLDAQDKLRFEERLKKPIIESNQIF